MKKLFLLVLTACLFVSYVSAKQPKAAKHVWFLMERQQDKEKLPNDSVVVTFQTDHTFEPYNLESFGRKMFPLPHLLISICNNTERTIYVDLQNSFVVQNGEIFPMFTNTTDVSTQGSTVGGGVNLGLVGVGGANTSSNSKVTQEQRFIAIPGETKKVLNIEAVMKWGTPWNLNNGCGSIQIFKDRYENYVFIEQNCIQQGLQEYSGSDNPMSLDFRINYSYSPDMNPSFVNKSVYYTKYCIGTFPVGSWSVLNKKDNDEARKWFPSLDAYEKAPNTLVLHVWGFANDGLR
ncbi:MAG: hypothetical protein J5761_04265 [Paludibacteraceae bacterium]|nr:hypothetical protein [Paludibacteraceae bacterium]